jgi:phosphatidylethanolamine-binding protein (PEBP) family uncharacterized protein
LPRLALLWGYPKRFGSLEGRNCRDKPHHYQITVFAVDVDKLPDAKNDTASAALVGFDLHFHTLAKATLTGLYGR